MPAAWPPTPSAAAPEASQPCGCSGAASEGDSKAIIELAKLVAEDDEAKGSVKMARSATPFCLTSITPKRQAEIKVASKIL